jgi:hypothetical protein
MAKTKSVEYSMFTYSIDHLEQKDKVLFYYALKGRDGKSGILKDCRIHQLGRTVILVPETLSSGFSEFLAHWKCPFRKKEIIIEEKSFK